MNLKVGGIGGFTKKAKNKKTKKKLIAKKTKPKTRLKRKK
jgi:hypothetical protein